MIKGSSRHVLILSEHYIQQNRSPITETLNIIVSYDQTGHLPVNVVDAAVLCFLLRGKPGSEFAVKALELTKELFIFGIKA